MLGGLLTETSLISDSFILSEIQKDPLSAPTLVNRYETQLCLEIMREPVYDISNRMWLGRNFDLGFELSLSKTNSINSIVKKTTIDKKFAKKLNEEWMPILKKKGRMWKDLVGLIPYRLKRKFDGEYKIDICEIGTGNIYVRYHFRSNYYKFYWVSLVKDMNNSRFEGKIHRELKYDKSVHFIQFEGESPYANGCLRSMLSNFIPEFLTLKKYRTMSLIQDEKKVYGDPMVIERDLPSTKDQLAVINHVRDLGIRKREANENIDGVLENEEQVIPQVLENVGLKKTDNINSEMSKILPLWTKDDVPKFRMTYKLHPNEKFKPLKIDDLSVKLEDVKMDFNKAVSTRLGSSFQPWTDTSSRTMSDANLVTTQLFTSTINKTELGEWEKVIRHWFYHLYGEPHFGVLIFKRTFNMMKNLNNEKTGRKIFGSKKRERGNWLNGEGPDPKREKKDEVEVEGNGIIKQGKPLNLKKIQVLEEEKIIDVKFIERPNVVRPNIEMVNGFYYANMLDADLHAQILSTITGIPLKPSKNHQEYFDAMQMENGKSPQLIKLQEEQMRVNIKQRKQTMQQGKEQFDLQKKGLMMGPGMGGGGGKGAGGGGGSGGGKSGTDVPKMSFGTQGFSGEKDKLFLRKRKID